MSSGSSISEIPNPLFPSRDKEKILFCYEKLGQEDSKLRKKDGRHLRITRRNRVKLH